MSTPTELPHEIEAKFYPVSPETLRGRLRELGAMCEQTETSMRRVIYGKESNPNINGTYLRVRDEGNVVRISLKVTASPGGNISDQREVDIETHDFERAKMLLDAIGCVATKYQENMRETWRLGASEVVIDTWPGLQPYAEIESPSEAELRASTDALNLPWEEKFIGSTDDLYAREYGISKEEALRLLNMCTFEKNPFADLPKA